MAVVVKKKKNSGGDDEEEEERCGVCGVVVVKRKKKGVVLKCNVLGATNAPLLGKTAGTNGCLTDDIVRD